MTRRAPGPLDGRGEPLGGTVGGVAEPAWRVMVEAQRNRAGLRVLDVGCGSGDLLAHLASAVPLGWSRPRPGMVRARMWALHNEGCPYL